MKQFKYTINGIQYNVEINDEVEGNKTEVNVNGTSYQVEIDRPEGSKAAPKISRPAPRPAVAPAAPKAAPVAAAPAAAPAGGGGGKAIQSPLPGVILHIKCNVGQEVKKGDVLIVLEAMKMENDIKADADGKVTAILVKEGDSIPEGTSLVTIG